MGGQAIEAIHAKRVGALSEAEYVLGLGLEASEMDSKEDEEEGFGTGSDSDFSGSDDYEDGSEVERATMAWAMDTGMKIWAGMTY